MYSSLPLRYTKDISNRLTMKQRLFYEKNGYLVFPGLIPQDVIDECHKRYHTISLSKFPSKTYCWKLNLYREFIYGKDLSYIYVYMSMCDEL